MNNGFYISAYGGAEVIKDPDEVVNFGIAWTDRLWPGSTVSSADWDVAAGLTEVNASINGTALTYKGVTHAANTVTIIQVQGGTAGARYTVTCHAVMSNGEHLDQSFIVDVRAK